MNTGQNKKCQTTSKCSKYIYSYISSPLPALTLNLFWMTSSSVILSRNSHVSMLLYLLKWFRYRSYTHFTGKRNIKFTREIKYEIRNSYIRPYPHLIPGKSENWVKENENQLKWSLQSVICICTFSFWKIN